MTQLLSPNAKRGETHDRPKHQELDRGSGRFDYLYGSSSPQLNRANPANLAPDERKSKGYRDGIVGVTTLSLMHDPHYNTGWKYGYSERQKQQIADEGLTPVWFASQIDEAVDRLPHWLELASQGETVEIRYITDIAEYWICASKSIVDRVLPF